MGGSTSSAIEIDAGHHWVVGFLGMQFNMDTLIMTWITMAIVIFLAWLATRKRSLVPHGWQNIMEMMLDWLQGQMKPTLGRYWPVVSGLLFTYFIFLLVANMLCLLPIHHIMSPTSDLNTTAGLAIFSTILVWAIGIHANGDIFVKHVDDLGSVPNTIAQVYTEDAGDTKPYSNGVLITNEPTQPYQCANKKYVDDAIASISPTTQTKYQHNLVLETWKHYQSVYEYTSFR